MYEVTIYNKTGITYDAYFRDMSFFDVVPLPRVAETMLTYI